MIAISRAGYTLHSVIRLGNERMNRYRFGAAALILGCLAGIGGTQARSERAPWTVDLSESSCAIQCPANLDTRYAGLGGSVGCGAHHAPLCQCTDDSRPIAGCVPLEP